MLIPQGQGVTRTLHLYSFQGWLALGLAAGLVFASAFYYQWYRQARDMASALERSNQELARARAAAPAVQGGLTADERADVERKVRAEYEEQNAVVARELGELRDLEESIRRVQKLPPRVKTYGPISAPAPAGDTGGKGGPPGDLADADLPTETDNLAPPQLIDGLSRPPTDLIIQEISLRTESLRDLLASMDEKRENVERTPMGWPTASAQRRLSSSFGIRRDPFNSALRQHDGLDITAPYGSPVLATAKGVVTASEYDADLGHVVRVDHVGGVVTVYGHMSERTASVGDPVERGDEVGRVGSTGRSTGNHIHYEVRLNKRAVDPENYLGN